MVVGIGVGFSVGEKFLLAVEDAGTDGVSSWVRSLCYYNKNGDAGETS